MNNKSILVVEDNPLNLKLVKALLKANQYNVFEAADAEYGIQIVEKHRLDLILMDIQLPGMDGLSATKAIKANDAFKDIPIVALTAHAMIEDEQKAMEVGCAGHISKPIDTRSFLKTINQYF